MIHVAGTNGKGSVCAFLEALLTQHGKKTASFTSPHVVKINETNQAVCEKRSVMNDLHQLR